MGEILEYFKDINFFYNDCSRYVSLSNMLAEFEEKIRAKAIDEFAERINKMAYDMEYNGLAGDVLISIWASTIDEIAEELKGGVSNE